MVSKKPTDYTAQSGNPSFALQAALDGLMSQPDFNSMAALAIKTVEEGGGISPEHKQEFKRTISDISKRWGGSGKERDELTKYIFNYILKGAGMGVVSTGGPREEIIAAFAADITEIIGENPVYTEQQLALKQLAEKYGFEVRLLDEYEMKTGMKTKNPKNILNRGGEGKVTTFGNKKAPARFKQPGV